MTDSAVPGSTAFSARPAAALAVLDLHTSDASGATGGDSAATGSVETPKGKGCGFLPRWLVWTLLLAIGGFGLVTGACLDACTGSNRIRHVPAIHGRVVDMETGQPIPGVRLTRYFVRNEFGGPGGGDQSIASGSWHTATSGADGTFELPGWWGLARGISSIEWGEFKPGWTAGWGTIILNRVPTLDIAGLHPPETSVLAESHREGPRSTIILKLHRVNTPPIAEDHFWAMRILIDEQIVREEDFVAEARTYLRAFEPSPAILEDIALVQSQLGGYTDDGPCYKARLAFVLQACQEETCRLHPEWRGCDPKVLASRREFLEQECRRFRGNP